MKIPDRVIHGDPQKKPWKNASATGEVSAPHGFHEAFLTKMMSFQECFLLEDSDFFSITTNLRL